MKVIKFGDRDMDFCRPLVMGILNVTPDSFYDGGKYLSEVRLIERIHRIVEEGLISLMWGHIPLVPEQLLLMRKRKSGVYRWRWS